MTSYWGVDHGEVSKADKRSLGFISNAESVNNLVRVKSGDRSALMGTKGWNQLKRTKGSAMSAVSNSGRKTGQTVESFRGVSKAYDFRRSENNTRRQNAAMGGAAGAIGGAAGYAAGAGAVHGGLRRARFAHRMGGSSLGRRALGFGAAGAIGGAAANAMLPAKKKKPTVQNPTVAKSYWGVVHEDVSKSDNARRHVVGQTALGAMPRYGALLSTAGGAATAKKGKRGAAAATQGASTLGGAVLGGMAGLSTRRPLGVVAGGMAGGAGGSYLGAVNNVQQGRVANVRQQKYPMQRSKKR